MVQDEIIDLRARLAGLHLLLYARALQARAADSQANQQDLTRPVRDEIAEVQRRLKVLGVIL